MSDPAEAATSDPTWLLNDLPSRVAGVRDAVLLSDDGLLIAASRGLSQDDAEYLAAVAAGFQSLSRGAGRRFGGGLVRQTVIEMDSAFLFVTAAGWRSCLAVLSSGECDVGLIAYEMAVLVQRVGTALSTAQRLGNHAGTT